MQVALSPQPIGSPCTRRGSAHEEMGCMRKGRRGWISLRMLTSDLRTGAADRDVETPASMPGMLEPGNLNVTALVGRPRRGLGRPRRGLGAASPGSGRPRRGLGGLAGVWPCVRCSGGMWAASPGSGLVFGVQVECGLVSAAPFWFFGDFSGLTSDHEVLKAWLRCPKSSGIRGG